MPSANSSLRQASPENEAVAEAHRRNLGISPLDMSGCSLPATAGIPRDGPSDEPIEIVLVPLLDELDCKASIEKSDDAADASPNGKRRSNRWLQLHRYRDPADRHVVDEAFMDGAVGQGQSRMRMCRNDARTLLP